jgi:hypothetical protein
MQAHIRNDVKPSVGRVIASEWLEMEDVGSIPLADKGCYDLDCYKSTSGDPNRHVPFHHFYRVYFASEKGSNAHL